MKELQKGKVYNDNLLSRKVSQRLEKLTNTCWPMNVYGMQYGRQFKIFSVCFDWKVPFKFENDLNDYNVYFTLLYIILNYPTNYHIDNIIEVKWPAISSNLKIMYYLYNDCLQIRVICSPLEFNCRVPIVTLYRYGNFSRSSKPASQFSLFVACTHSYRCHWTANLF